MSHKLFRQNLLRIGIPAAVFSVLLLMAVSFYVHRSLPLKQEASDLSKNATSQFFKLPIQFEYNDGQTAAMVRYLTRGPGYTFYFTPQEVVMVLKNGQQSDLSPAVLKMRFVDANSNPTIKGIDELRSKSHYFIGNDKNHWRSNIPNYRKVAYQDLYPGIDAIFYGNLDQLEYDICVAPGTNPSLARFSLEGAEELAIADDGSLRIRLRDNQELRMQKPFVYQLISGEKVSIEAQFSLLAKNEVGFKIGNYDEGQDLVIDPVLVYSTYLGGSGADTGIGIAVDDSRNMYVTGQTSSTNFPLMNAFQATFGGATDAFITKFDETGTTLIYSTYLGGTANDGGAAIAVDGAGNAYITGNTSSSNFPVLNAFQPALAGVEDAFVAKLDASGALVYSTYLGGALSDRGNGIVVDSSGNAYVTGQTSSIDFPVLNPFQAALAGGSDAFLTKFDSTGSALVYSTYLGGTANDVGNAVTVDRSGNAYVTGQTASTNFPVLNAFQAAALGGGNDAFLTKFDRTGSALVYSTYLGGTGNDTGNAISLDSSANVYLAGTTNSTNFPVVNAFQPAVAGSSDAFVTKFNAAGSALIYSTYLGGSGIDTGTGIAVDQDGSAYVTGLTFSANFPTQNPFQAALQGSRDSFVTKFTVDGSSLVFSTYFGGTGVGSAGGIAIDSAGNTYITGGTNATDLPVTTDAFQPANAGGIDTFVAKFAIGTPVVLSISPRFGPESGGTAVVITGVNFANTTAVDFGGIPAAFVIDSDTQITAISPPGTGTVPVTLTGVGGTSAPSVAGQFSYQAVTATNLFVVPNPAAFGEAVTLTAVITPPSVVGTVSFFDGTTLLGTVSLSGGTATLTVSSFSIGSHSLTAVYSGASNFEDSVSLPVILTVNSSIAPPSHLRGKQEANRFLSQTEFANHLTWDAPSQGLPPASYKIYRDASLKHAIATISSDERLEFVDRNRRKNKTYTYYVVSIDQFGNRSTPAVVRVKG